MKKYLLAVVFLCLSFLSYSDSTEVLDQDTNTGVITQAKDFAKVRGKSKKQIFIETLIPTIEKIRDNVKEFDKGYTMFITNDISYTKKPIKDNCVYKQFSLEDKIVKSGKMFWEKTASKGTMMNCEKPIILKDSYNINWKYYSKLDNENTGTFMYVVNEIKNN